MIAFLRAGAQLKNQISDVLNEAARRTEDLGIRVASENGRPNWIRVNDAVLKLLDFHIFPA